MTDVAAAPLPEQAEEEAAIAEPSATSFAELVWVHHRWAQAFRSGVAVPRELEASYRAKLRAFEAEHGELLNAYWCSTSASAVTLTVKPAWGPLRYFGREPAIRYHRATDWVTRRAPALTHVLHRCDALAIRASEVLRGTTERIALQLILSVATHVLAFVDRGRDLPDEAALRDFVRQEQRELDAIEQYYDRAAGRVGRVVYFWGMIAGLAVLALLAAVLALCFAAGGLWDGQYAFETNLFFACYAAGALGAVVSVMTRLHARRGFHLEYEIGRKTIRRLGSFRPLVGAIFGVAAYFLVESGLLQIEPADGKEFYFLTIVAFLAGFSERWTRVVFDSAEARVARAPSEPSGVPGAAAEDALVADPAREPLDVEALEQELGRASRGAEEVAKAGKRNSP
jgi:hypothetical protein